MRWRKLLFRVWLVGSIAWSGFYVAVALLNYVHGNRGNYWWIAAYALTPGMLGLVVWALAWGFRR